MGLKLASARALFDHNLAAASRGKPEAYFELGMACSTGSDGVEVDMVEAHKWFNLAALAGVREGSLLRAEIALEMDAHEIAEAQRQARAWIAGLGAATSQRRAA